MVRSPAEFGATAHKLGRKSPVPKAIFIVTLVAVGVATLIGTNMVRRARAVAGATEAAGLNGLSAPPCPMVLRWSGRPPQKAFEFNGITFARRFGHADCHAVAVRPGGRDFDPVCQFTGPDVLEITTPKGGFRFAPGVGQPATVVVRRGLPECVMASRFKFG